MSEKDSNDKLSGISSSSESSDNDAIPDIGLLKPYDHELRRTSLDEGSLSDESSICSTDSETLSIGNTDWCSKYLQFHISKCDTSC